MIADLHTDCLFFDQYFPYIFQLVKLPFNSNLIKTLFLQAFLEGNDFCA